MGEGYSPKWLFVQDGNVHAVEGEHESTRLQLLIDGLVHKSCDGPVVGTLAPLPGGGHYAAVAQFGLSENCAAKV